MPDDYQEIKKETDKAIEQGLSGSNSEWREMALETLFNLCKAKDYFTANDLRALVAKSELKTHDNRAMGGVMVTGRKNGWLEPTGNSIPSRVGHKTPLQIWRSKIYEAVHN